MNNVKTKSIQLPDITVSEESLNNITIVNPIEFLSEEENQKIIGRIKDGVRNLNNPDRWMTWEESEKLIWEECFEGKV